MDGLQEYIDKRIKEDGDPSPTLDVLNSYLAEFMERRNNMPEPQFEGYLGY